jgi:hypothetical protein
MITNAIARDFCSRRTIALQTIADKGGINISSYQHPEVHADPRAKHREIVHLRVPQFPFAFQKRRFQPVFDCLGTHAPKTRKYQLIFTNSLSETTSIILCIVPTPRMGPANHLTSSLSRQVWTLVELVWTLLVFY